MKERACRTACVSSRGGESKKPSGKRKKILLTETADGQEKPPLWYHPCGGIHKNLICVLQA